MPRPRTRPLAEIRPEIVALIDLSIVGARGHTVAANALFQAFADAGEREDGVSDQKILLAKICAEEVAALEDLGALAWAVANRQRGIIKTYLEYQPKEVKRFYQAVSRGSALLELLRLPALEGLPISKRERGRMARALRDLQQSFTAAANNYLALNEGVVHIYNRLKHGFAIVQRVDLITPNSTGEVGWEQRAHVLVGVRRDGLIKYSSIERTEAMLEETVDFCACAQRLVRLAADERCVDVGASGS